jgi:hypothetical protein
MFIATTFHHYTGDPRGCSKARKRDRKHGWEEIRKPAPFSRLLCRGV